jgi:hypothetical protein
MQDKDMLQRAIEVQARHTDALMEKPHVVGVAVGTKQVDGVDTGEMCLIVMVDEKVPDEQLNPEDRIPEEIDGVPVDVLVTGTFEAQ